MGFAPRPSGQQEGLSATAGLFKKGGCAGALAGANSGRAVDWRRQVLRPAVGAIFPGHGRPLRRQRRGPMPRRSKSRPTHRRMGRPPQARPVQRDAHPHCVRSFFVLRTTLPHCNMAVQMEFGRSNQLSDRNPKFSVAVRASADGRFTFEIFTVSGERFGLRANTIRARLMPSERAMRSLPPTACRRWTLIRHVVLGLWRSSARHRTANSGEAQHDRLRRLFTRRVLLEVPSPGDYERGRAAERQLLQCNTSLPRWANNGRTRCKKGRRRLAFRRDATAPMTVPSLGW
jgi:hypothetical protein